jgi:hypothetical protein
MRPKRPLPIPPSPPPEISGPDRDLLANAYKAGLILGWKQDRDHGYRLTLGNQRDEYVENTKLSSYLDKLRSGSTR